MPGPPYYPIVPKSTGDRWMGVPETAAYLGVIQRTVYRLINTEKIPAYKIGRVIRLKREDVDAWLESRRVHPGDLDHLYPPLLGHDRNDDHET